ncbi:hypothetical protein HY493_04065 [Candidatus Woesearchaeota archaeon]|nr:hypothetical protein [Candidatus Woesearchaeota archaeon]
MKNKDLLLKNVVNITHNEGGWTLTVIKKDGIQNFLIIPHLDTVEALTAKLQPDTNACLVVLNARKNLDVIAERWGELVNYPKLCVIFANPESSTDKRWIIFPHTHDKITERKTLKLGLESLFAMVEEVR